MSCNCDGILIAGGTSSIKLTGATNDQSGDYENALSLTYGVFEYGIDADTGLPAVGDAVSGATGSLTYQAASNGNYFGTIDKTAELVAESDYWIVITDATYGVIKEAVVSTY